MSDFRPTICTQVGEPVCQCCHDVRLQAVENDRLRAEVERLTDVGNQLDVAAGFVRRLTESFLLVHHAHIDHHGNPFCRACDLLLEVWDWLPPAHRVAVFGYNPHLPRPGATPSP